MSNTRTLPVPGVRNFRDMGGYETASGRPLAFGRLYRSGHLADIEDGAEADLVARRIGTVIDFRSDTEKQHNPVKEFAHWKPAYHATPIGGNAAAWVRELHDRLATSPFPAKDLRDQFMLAFETIPVANVRGLRRFFDILVESPRDEAVLFHCTAGKDRTGIAGALLFQALGVAPDQIMEDFLLTNEAVDLPAASAKMAGWISERSGRPIEPEAVLPLVGVEPAFLEAAYASIARAFGSVEDYLEKEMGLTAERRRRLQGLFLTP